jgi:hypothetical protein
MTEIERRLRAAMHAAVDDEQPPANLLGSVRTRHRRHRTRTAIAGVAIVAAGAVALPPATSALRGGTPSGYRPASPPTGPPRAAPGTVLNSCSDQIAVNLSLDWRTNSVQAGPLWFVGLRQATASYYGHSRLAIGGLSVNVRDGATVWVKVVGPAAGHFRFLFGPNDFTLGVDGRYTLRDGENGVTFAGCSRSSPWPGESFSYVPGYTEFGGRYLIDKIPRRVSLDVWTSASRHPTRITFLVGY